MPKKISKNTSPKGYLSWSQLQLWEKDPNLYYQVYVEGCDQFRTKYLDLGKRMADTLEKGFDVEHDPAMEIIALSMPEYPLREFDIKETFEGIPLVGKLDGFNEKTLEIGEYKTGKLWNPGMVKNSGQLTFYALLVWLRYKTLPKAISLHWAQTGEDLEGNLKLTGMTKTFKTERTMKDIIVFSKRIKNAWAGICELGQFTDNRKMVV